MQKVNVWKEIVSIPTYDIGVPEKNPVFIEKRVYQGSSGAVYPYPVIEKIEDRKVDRDYIALYLENDFIKIMILPELGGRVQMAYDKTKERHFVYYNHVIKPALVGLTGPWISGGIEFNWPQHHRPTTFSPVDFSIRSNEDGSATVWCSELERMFRTKGMAGFTLYPDKAYLEIKVQLYNRTPFPQTFLWWANPAVKVNDHYQSVFPPDVNAVFDHGKRDVSSFPIAKGTYYKVDYSPGTDISRYKNIPVPTSYMAITSKYDFVGGYENDVQGGLLHVADHHVSPGKKQWTWGNGDFGKAWDRNLTDQDGPYIELMCGVYTDNQPDFTWLMPNEQKDFVQYFMPYRDLGVVKNATQDAMINLERDRDNLLVKVYTTGLFPGMRIQLRKGKEVLLDEVYDGTPHTSFERKVEYRSEELEGLYLEVRNANGGLLVDWDWEGPNTNEIPEPAKAAQLPEDIVASEQLFLTGQHLEQYRHATYSPVPYYLEAIRRDSGDVRCNNAMGLWLMRKAKFKEAETYLRTAVGRLLERNPNPYDGEPLYNLAQALKFQEKCSEAYTYFYKACWNAAWQNAAYLQLAQLDALKGNLEDALKHVEKSLSKNTEDHKALHLKVAIFRKISRNSEALQLLDKALKKDVFNYGLYFEKYLLLGDGEILTELHVLLRGNIHNYIEYALDYASAGFYTEAIVLLEKGIEGVGPQYPMALYYLGWFSKKMGDGKASEKYYQKAALAEPTYCFPNHIEGVAALEDAKLRNGKDAKAPYYLGNFWYAAKQYEDAGHCWETSIERDSTFPTAYRNLALAYYNKLDRKELALQYLEKAFHLDPTDARVLMELDQLYKRCNRDVVYRLLFLEQHLEVVVQRDDVYLERVALYNILGQHKKAFTLLKNRKFHPWEGGEGKVATQYVTALVEMAKKKMSEGDYKGAIALLERCEMYPENLGEGKLDRMGENHINYWLGNCFEALGIVEEAEKSWLDAVEGPSEPTAAIFYNDPQPDSIFYQGLALMKLNREGEARERFHKLMEYGRNNMENDIQIDYFAVSLPDLLIWERDLAINNSIHCLFVQALGATGLGDDKSASNYLEQILALENSHMGAAILKVLLAKRF